MVHSTNKHGTCADVSHPMRPNSEYMCTPACAKPVIVALVTPGQAAYEVTEQINRDIAKSKQQTFETWTPWIKLTGSERIHWERVAHAVIKQVMQNTAIRCYCGCGQ